MFIKQHCNISLKCLVKSYLSNSWYVKKSWKNTILPQTRVRLRDYKFRLKVRGSIRANLIYIPLENHALVMLDYAFTIQEFYTTGSYDSRFKKVLAGARAGAHKGIYILGLL